MKRSVHRHEVVQPLDQSYRLIPLTQEQNAIVDAADYQWLRQWNWYAHFDPSFGKFYAKRHSNNGNGTWREFMMHRVILGLKGKKKGDHANGDTLDNRRANLRPCNNNGNAQNKRLPKNNTSGYKGVYHRIEGGYASWYSFITVRRKRIHLGVFESAIDAAEAYDAAALKYHGRFARLNFPIANAD